MSFATVRKAMNFPAGVATGLATAAMTPRGSHYLAMAMRNVSAFTHEHPGAFLMGGLFGLLMAASAEGEMNMSSKKATVVGLGAGAAVTTAICLIF